jgi:TolA-binding protein
MKILFLFVFLCSAYVAVLWNFGGLDNSFVKKWNSLYENEQKALILAKENRVLRGKISDLQYQISQLESKNRYFVASTQKTQKTNVERKVASVPKTSAQDLVAYEVYKWAPEKLLAIGEKELHFKNYEKSAQFYSELIDRFPTHAIVTDRVLFGAGVAAFETHNRYEWAEKYLSRLVKEHPKSDFYRGAKLWLALSQYKQGQNEKFLATVEEFRLKYRNTEEWKILSRYYEDISYKIKK